MGAEGQTYGTGARGPEAKGEGGADTPHPRRNGARKLRARMETQRNEVLGLRGEAKVTKSARRRT